MPQNSFEQPQQPQQQRGGGSGVIISPDGYIVTNNHVVEDASEVKVTLNDNRTFTAKVIGTDPTTDVALVKIDATDLPNIPFGESDALRLGEWVLAIGSPYGLQSTVTAGIISAKARNLDIIPSQFRIESFIQTDAAVNPGNSGGAGQHPRRAGRYQHRNQIAHRQFCRLLVRRTHLDRQKSSRRPERVRRRTAGHAGRNVPRDQRCVHRTAR
ncbi:MAG: S1C family serine protease [Alistipes indistinctus]